jgi:predicted transcriptional regulator
MMITAAQCRSARTLLGWSVSRLASAASVSQCDIDDFELERCMPRAATRRTIRCALEAAGMVFVPYDDVRVCAVPAEIQNAGNAGAGPAGADLQ